MHGYVLRLCLSVCASIAKIERRTLDNYYVFMFNMHLYSMYARTYLLYLVLLQFIIKRPQDSATLN